MFGCIVFAGTPSIITNRGSKDRKGERNNRNNRIMENRIIAEFCILNRFRCSRYILITRVAFDEMI